MHHALADGVTFRSRDGVTFRARDGVTSRYGVTLGRRNGVTSDLIGGHAPKLPVWELVLGLAPAQDVDLSLAYPQFEHLIGEVVVSMTAVPDRTLNLPSGHKISVETGPKRPKVYFHYSARSVRYAVTLSRSPALRCNAFTSRPRSRTGAGCAGPRYNVTETLIYPAGPNI